MSRDVGSVASIQQEAPGTSNFLSSILSNIFDDAFLAFAARESITLLRECETQVDDEFTI